MEFIVSIHGDEETTIGAAVDASGSILASSKTGASDPLTMGFQASSRMIYSVISELCLAVGSPPFSYRWASVSTTGLERHDDRELLYRHLRGTFGLVTKLSLHTDLEATFSSAFPKDEGILLVADMRSFACSVVKGQVMRAGGYGPLLDEEGSDYWIGREALRAIVHSYDGRSPPSQLSVSILNWLSKDNPTEIAEWAMKAKIRDIASISPLVSGAAKSADPIAVDIMKRAGHELAKMVWAVWRKSGLRTPVEVRVSGESFRSSDILPKELAEELRNMGLETALRTVNANPLHGDTILALQSAGIVLTKGIVSKAETELYSLYK